jgi:hypothetical protein
MDQSERTLKLLRCGNSNMGFSFGLRDEVSKFFREEHCVGVSQGFPNGDMGHDYRRVTGRFGELNRNINRHTAEAIQEIHV